MKTVSYKSKKTGEEAAFCRICYIQGSGRGRAHLSMEADRPQAAVTAIAAMVEELAKRTGLCTEDAINEIEREITRREESA